MGLFPRFAEKSRSNVFSDSGGRKSLRICCFSSCPSMGDSPERNSDTKIQKPSEHLLEFPSSRLHSE